MTAKIVASSSNVQSNVKVSEKAITFNTGLFRCKEYIRFEALAEVPAEDSPKRKEEESIEKRLINSLNITHRIADTQKIKIKGLTKPDFTRERFKKRLIPMSVNLIFPIFIIVYFYFFLGPPANLHYIVPVESGGTVEVKVRACNDGTLKIKGVDDKSYRKTMSPESFFKTPNIIPKVVPDKLFKFLIVPFLSLLFLFQLLIIGLFYLDNRKTKRILQLLDISE